MPMRTYIAHSPALGLVKIGCSANPNMRMRHLSKACGFHAILVEVLRGRREREAALLRRFADHAVGHEWFRPEGNLAAFLEERGHGHLNGQPINAVRVGRMKRKYTMRLKNVREDYIRRYAVTDAATLRRNYMARKGRKL